MVERHSVTYPVFEQMAELQEYIRKLELIASACKFPRNRVLDDIEGSPSGQWVAVPHQDFDMLRNRLSALDRFLTEKTTK